MGGEEILNSIGIFVAEKWMDSVVTVKRCSKRVLILKMVLDSGSLNILTVYARDSGKLQEEKEFLEQCRWIKDLRVCRRAKLSHLQHFVYEAGIPVGDICGWSC